MAMVIGYDDAKNKPLKRPTQLAYFEFPDQKDMPHARLQGHEPGTYSEEPHFHENDQFQVMVEGKLNIGRHELTPYCVHFTRAYTPYGPLISDGQAFAFMVMRAHRDPGKMNMSQHRLQLERVPNRQPWQVSQKVTFPPPEARTSSDVITNQIPNIKDDRGLAAYTMILKPNVKAAAPDASRGDGQYLVVVKGSFWHSGREQKALGLVFVRPDERTFELHAGATGLEAIVLNFPQAGQRQEVQTPITAGGHKKLRCALCSFTYDEALGMPHEGIPAGTRWADVPAHWCCPDCSATKSDFQMVEIA